MGNSISVDSSPILYSSLVKYVASPTVFHHSFKSNIKAWSFQPDRTDRIDAEITPVDFTNFTTFDNKKCYILLHLFRKNFVTPPTNHNTVTQNHLNSLFGLAISTSKQLTPRGLEHRFSVHDLQTTFFQEALQHTCSNQTSSQVSYDLYLWHGKESPMTIQAAAITRGFEIERKLLESNIPDSIFESGKPVPLVRYFHDDVPPVRNNLSNLSHHKTSSVALYMSLYQHCHLFRTLANLDTEEETVDDCHDVAFRSLLQLPPLDMDDSSSKDDLDEEQDFIASPRDDDDEAMSTSSSKRSDDFEEEMEIQKPIFKNLPLNKLNLQIIDQSPRKRGVPDGFMEFDSKRMPKSESIDSSDSSRGSNGSGSFRLPLNSIDRSDNPLDPSPTPRSKLVDIDSTRPMSGSEMVVYYRKICSQVYDYIYQGSDLVARNKETLQANGITHIINAALSVCDIYFANDFTYYTLSLYDAGNESIIGAFFGVIDFIEKARINGGKIFIHCYEGVSRSSTLTIAYIMWKTGQSFNSVVEQVKKRRPVSSPNPGFIVQLLQWEKMLSKPQYYLYRISALNDMYPQHQQLIPKLCRTNILDDRTCFVLHAAADNVVFIYVGRKLIVPALYNEAHRFALLLQRYFSGQEKLEIITLQADEAEEDDDFLDLLDLCPVDPGLVEEKDVYPDLEHLRTIDDKKGLGAEATKVERPIDEDEEFEEADLYAYPSLEKVENFDSDDLTSDSIYILHPHPVDENEVVYVWLGQDCNALAKRHESLEYAGKDAAKVFISKKCLPAMTDIIVVLQDDEPEEFWRYFANG
jgi:predicted protein tyrosine phosphatase